MSPSNSIITAEGITKTYRMGATQVQVLKGASLAVRAGEFVAIVGASGSGKSTLLHILGGLDRPDQGLVRFRGEEVGRYTASGLNRFRNRQIGFVFQFYHLLDELNVMENVLVPAMAGRGLIRWMAARSGLKKRAQGLLEQVGLSHRLRHRPYQLSGGERQRVAIARALMNEPEVLLADEPTGNLDSVTGNSILKLLERLHTTGQTIVLVTHDLRIAEQAGRIVTLVDGITVARKRDAGPI